MTEDAIGLLELVGTFCTFPCSSYLDLIILKTWILVCNQCHRILRRAVSKSTNENGRFYGILNVNLTAMHLTISKQYLFKTWSFKMKFDGQMYCSDWDMNGNTCTICRIWRYLLSLLDGGGNVRVLEGFHIP